MEVWNLWTGLITYLIDYLSLNLGLSEALAIILFTLLARLALMPVSLVSSYRMCRNRLTLQRLQPAVEALKEQYPDDLAERSRQTMALYKKHGVKMLDKTTVLNMASQTVLGIGVFQALGNMLSSSRFLWIANIAKPDIALTLLVSIAMVAGMLTMPGATDQSYWLLLIPVAITAFVLISMPSALALYWATSNVVSIGQNLALQGYVSRCVKNDIRYES